MGFLILDGMLGYPARLYDGSWMEWGQMTSNAPDRKGALAADSPWRTDVEFLTTPVTYNADPVYALTVDTVAGANSYALRSDLVNVTDSSVCGGGRPGAGPAAPGY